MGNAIRRLAGVCLLMACVAAVIPGSASLASGAPPAHTLAHHNLIEPVRVWRDCQRISRCSGCAPVYRCRSCSYQRQCRRGLCEWGDVCAWGPYLPLAPKGVPVY